MCVQVHLCYVPLSVCVSYESDGVGMSSVQEPSYRFLTGKTQSKGIKVTTRAIVKNRVFCRSTNKLTWKIFIKW